MEFNFWELFKNTFSFLFKFWQLWVILIAIVAISIIVRTLLPRDIEKFKAAIRFKKGSQWGSDRDLLQWLRGMTPKEFEEYIAELFSRLGYKTDVTGGAYDGGIDVVAEKDGIKQYIQCKKFIGREVGVAALRDFYGAIANRLTNAKGYFITTNKFTLEAERFAEDKPIELVDEFKLVKYIRLAEKDAEKTRTKICPKCGGKLIERVGKYGKFLGCSNYPKCKYTENIKN